MFSISPLRIMEYTMHWSRIWCWYIWTFTWSMKYFLGFQAKGLENRMESLKISESVEQNASAVNDNMAGLQPPFISATINSPIPGSHQAQSLNYTLSSMMPNTTVATQQASSQMPAIAQPNHQMLPQYLQNLSPVSPAQSYSQQVRSPVMPMVQSPQAALQNRGTFWIWRSSHLRVFIAKIRLTQIHCRNSVISQRCFGVALCCIAVYPYVMLQVTRQMYQPMWSDRLCVEFIWRNLKYISISWLGTKKPC